MVSCEHKVKNIYLGDDSWSPGSDTMLYVPMKEDLLDHSLNNVSITNNGISLDNTILSNMGVGYFKGSSEDRLEFSGIEFGNNDFTISWRERTLGNSNSQGTRFSTMYNSGSNWAGLLVGYQWTNLYAGTGGGSWNIVNGQQVFSSTTNTRVHRVLTKEGGNWKIYRNNVLFGSTTGSGSVGYSTEVIGNYRPGDKNPFYGYMSEFIIEKKVWTQQEITKYFKKTRTDYGYSNKDYQEVEYIESSGTQYIDTGYKHNANTQVDIKIALNSLTGQRNTFYGGRTAYNNADAMSINTNYTNYFSINIGGLTSDTIHTFNINTDYEISAAKTYFKVNGTNYNISTNLSTCQYTDYLLALNNVNTITPVNGTAKLYYCKISENGVLVRDFVPCYRTADDAIGLYDKVNNVFYTNSGTGTFTKGPDVGN